MTSIGEVSAALGVSARTLRHYDRQGLVAVERDHRNVRRFSAAARQELEIVVRLRGAGISLEEIRWVLETARRSGPAGLRNTAIDCLAYRLTMLTADRIRAEQTLDWVRALTASAEGDSVSGPEERIKGDVLPSADA